MVFPLQPTLGPRKMLINRILGVLVWNADARECIPSASESTGDGAKLPDGSMKRRSAPNAAC